MNVIDPDNPIPKYLQISAWIKDLIQSGRYEKGGALPSEVELARICQVNRNTLRQAIAELTAAGVLRKEKGRGTFVCAESPLAITHQLKSISSFSDDLRELGIKETDQNHQEGGRRGEGAGGQETDPGPERQGGGHPSSPDRATRCPSSTRKAFFPTPPSGRSWRWI